MPTASDAAGTPITGWRAVAASKGGCHSCGVTDAGALLCWGCDDDGELGPPPEVVGGWVAVAAGKGFTCGVDAVARAARCWGRFLPRVPVGGAWDGPWASVSAGEDFVCAVARDAGDASPGGGVAECKGWGLFGQTEVPTRKNASASESVIRWRSLSAGFQHACGVDALGAARCWGSDLFGESGLVPVVDAEGATLATVADVVAEAEAENRPLTAAEKAVLRHAATLRAFPKPRVASRARAPATRATRAPTRGAPSRPANTGAAGFSGRAGVWRAGARNGRTRWAAPSPTRTRSLASSRFRALRRRRARASWWSPLVLITRAPSRTKERTARTLQRYGRYGRHGVGGERRRSTSRRTHGVLGRRVERKDVAPEIRNRVARVADERRVGGPRRRVRALGIRGDGVGRRVRRERIRKRRDGDASHRATERRARDSVCVRVCFVVDHLLYSSIRRSFRRQQRVRRLSAGNQYATSSQ